MKTILKTIGWLLLAAIILWGIHLLPGVETPFSRLGRRMHEAFVPQQTIWTDTPIVESIRSMQQFVTASYYEELPIVSTKDRQWPIPDDDLVIIYNVTIEAGFDLSRLTEADVTLQGDSAISVRLPAPGILTRRCNPSDKTVFHDSDKWSQADLDKMHQQALDQVEHHALRDGLMTDAIANGCGCITRLLCSFGFEQKHVVVYVSTP
jgi:hypothetical protein